MADNADDKPTAAKASTKAADYDDAIDTHAETNRPDATGD